MASSLGFSLNLSSLADVLVLCDGGCDVLLTGVETGLATPVEESQLNRFRMEDGGIFLFLV